MTLICNKKNENKNDYTEKMKYCTTLVANKNKPVTSFSCHLKEA